MTRPSNRRDQILVAAAGQFWHVGYHHSSMADVAAAVGITASALYRHFTGKQDLLVAVLRAAVAATGDLPADLDGRIAALVEIALNRRELGALWDRESGHLPEVDRKTLRARLVKALDGTATALDGDDPGLALLRAQAVHAVLGSPSYHHVTLARPRQQRLLTTAAHAVVSVELPGTGGDIGMGRERQDPQLPISRREALLGAAIRLFGRYGYPSVSMTDIGRATGVTGSSVYKHFNSKDELLVSALSRGNEVLWLTLHHALADADGPLEALANALSSYVTFAVDNPEIVSVLVTEGLNLSPDHRERYRLLQREYVAEWVALLRRTQPERDEPEARFVVHAALAVTNTLARASALRKRPAIAAEINALGRAILRIPLGDPLTGRRARPSACGE